MRKILLTGQIGAGKSTLLNLLKSDKVLTISADDLVRKIYVEQPAVLQEISRELDLDPLKNSGEFDRQKLAAAIFSDANARSKVEAIVHPIVKIEFEKSLQGRTEEVCIYENAVVRALSDYSDFSEIVYVVAPVEMRIARLLNRGMKQSDIEQRIANEVRWNETPENFIIFDNSFPESELAPAAAKLKRDLGI